MQLLLLSNSTRSGDTYFSFVMESIFQFLEDKSLLGCFIPYAGVSISYEDYFHLIKSNLSESPWNIESVHHYKIPADLIEKADFLMIGGGNTFHLLAELQRFSLIEPIKKKVLENTPYVGWSAGSNVCSPTICTTNDMPIICPENFNALNLIPFQINPHYTNAAIPNHAGETRDTRIKEYIEINRDIWVAGLPENCYFRIDNQNLYFKGERVCRIFKYGSEIADLNENDDFQFLMQ